MVLSMTTAEQDVWRVLALVKFWNSAVFLFFPFNWCADNLQEMHSFIMTWHICDLLSFQISNLKKQQQQQNFNI